MVATRSRAVATLATMSESTVASGSGEVTVRTDETSTTKIAGNRKVPVSKKRSTVVRATVAKSTVADIEDIWRRDLAAIAEMRKNQDAAVDSMGCHMLHDREATPEVQRWQILVALMLSSQTKDEVNAAAMQRLRAHGNTVENIIRTDRAELERLLCPVSFYKTKAKHLQEAASEIKDNYTGDIPRTFGELCKLKGVGPKMANLVMQTAWGETVGIAVDTHVHRISNRLGWINTSTPEQTMTQLEAILPKDEWARVNKLMVGFGQQRCLPVRPKCENCLLKETCPASNAKTRKGKGGQEEEEEEEGVEVKNVKKRKKKSE